MTIDEFMRKFSAVAKDFRVKKGVIQHKKTKCSPLAAVAGHTHSFMNSYAEQIGRKMGLSAEDTKAIIVATNGFGMNTLTRPKPQRQKMNAIRARFLKILCSLKGIPNHPLNRFKRFRAWTKSW